MFSEREETREKERRRERKMLNRGRDACYETTTRESPVRRDEARRGEEGKEEERRGEERRGEQRRGVEPVGRALCTSGRSFSISPPIPCSPSPLFLSRSVSLCSSFTFFVLFISFSLSLSLSLSLSFALAYSIASPLFPALFALPPPCATPLEPLRLSVIISALASG